MELNHLQQDVDPEQIVFEMYGLILALHHDARFLKKSGSVSRAERGFERMIQSYAPAKLSA
jgi:hypothetical protein